MKYRSHIVSFNNCFKTNHNMKIFSLLCGRFFAQITYSFAAYHTIERLRCKIVEIVVYYTCKYFPRVVFWYIKIRNSFRIKQINNKGEKEHSMNDNPTNPITESKKDDSIKSLHLPKWNNEAVTESLQTFVKEIKHNTVKNYEVWRKKKKERPPIKWVYQYFGTWEKAMVAIKAPYPPEPERKPSGDFNQLKSRVIEALLLFIEEEESYTEVGYYKWRETKKRQYPGMSHIRKVFGKWSIAMKEMNVPYHNNHEGLLPEDMMRVIDEIKKAVIASTTVYGNGVTKKQYNEWRNTNPGIPAPHSITIIKYFGSWTNMKKILGLKICPSDFPSVRYSNEDILDALCKASTECEYSLTTYKYKEWRKRYPKLNIPSEASIISRFGTWSNAMELAKEKIEKSTNNKNAL